MPGVLTMLASPSAARVRNQTTVIGPKSLPTLPVPWLWIAKRPTMIPTVTGTTHFASAGVATDRPSTADSTEIAGVMTASP